MVNEEKVPPFTPLAAITPLFGFDTDAGYTGVGASCPALTLASCIVHIKAFLPDPRGPPR